MKNLITRWLGITYLEHEARDHQIQIGHIYKRLLMVQEKTRSKPKRYDEIPELLRDWYAEFTDWISFPMPADSANDAHAAKAIAALKL